MAHKKSGGSSKNGRDSNPQYRGIKLYAGQAANPNDITDELLAEDPASKYLILCGGFDFLVGWSSD